MAKFKYILTAIILLCYYISFAQPAQYTPMTASGYQMKRLKVDSTLHLPSFCGVPNLRNSVVKDGALAIDTCNAILYMWTNIGGWDTINISGGGGDFWKTSGITTLTDDVFIQSDSIIAFQGKYDEMKIFGVNSMKIDLLTTTGNINLIGLNVTTDTSTYKPLGIDVDGKLAPLTSWINGGSTIDTTSLSNRINLKLNVSDTANMLSNYSTRINSKLNISDTANKWVNRLTRTPGKDSIIYFVDGNRFAIKDSVGTGGSSQNGRFGNDTATVVMVKVHNESGIQLTNGKVVAFSTSGTQSNEPAVKLANNKHDSTSANTLGFVAGTIAINDTGWVILSGKIEKLNTSAFSNGDIIYLDSVSGNWTKTKPQAPYHMVYLGVVVKANAGNGSIFVKCQNGYELDEIHDVKITSPLNNQILVYSDTQKLWKNRDIYTIVDTTNKIATKSNVASKLNISDTASMLSNYSTRINGKLNISDTASMLSNYSTRINGKLNISDTAGFQRKSISSYSILANNTNASANATAQYFKDTSGTFTGSIAWSGTAPTTGNFSYRWTRIGKMVNINITLAYSVAGSTNNQVIVGLPSDAPTPSKPAGLTSASNLIYPALSQINGAASTLTSSTMRAMLRNNSSNNGFEFLINCAPLSATHCYITCTYFTD